jgi:GMP synthase-like glutamine amidotransferase
MIGLLNAYQQLNSPPYQQQYVPMFLSSFAEIAPQLKFQTFNVAMGQLPKKVDECKGWIISGSPKGAYDIEQWVVDLGNFVKQCHESQTKLVGICFGHQLIAQYLGGKTEKSAKGWGVGIQACNVIENTDWMNPRMSQVSMIYSHQDQVVKLPPGATLLAESSFCPHQMFSVGKHIFSIQGHPEFTPAFAKSRLDSRVEAVGKERYEQAVASLTLPTQNREVGQWIGNFFK